jgi:acyl-coenzyme A thioesterase PaaI-like protein
MRCHIHSKENMISDDHAMCHLLKVGRTLVVGEVALHSLGNEELVADAVGTYSIPPARDTQSLVPAK